VESQCTSHNFIVFAISVLECFTFGVKAEFDIVLTKIILHSFLRHSVGCSLFVAVATAAVAVAVAAV